MNEKPLRTTLAHPTPELPVEDIERAQRHYRDALGFEMGWLEPGGEIGASRAITSRSSSAEETGRSILLFTGSSPQRSTRRTRNCARSALASSSRSKGSPGGCVSSPWKTSTETASTFTATDHDAIREEAPGREISVQSEQSPILRRLRQKIDYSGTSR